MQSLIVTYIHDVWARTGFEGTINFNVTEIISAEISVSSRIEKCMLALHTIDEIILDDDAIDEMNRLDQALTFGVPAQLLHEARTRVAVL